MQRIAGWIEGSNAHNIESKEYKERAQKNLGGGFGESSRGWRDRMLGRGLWEKEIRGIGGKKEKRLRM